MIEQNATLFARARDTANRRGAASVANACAFACVAFNLHAKNKTKTRQALRRHAQMARAAGMTGLEPLGPAIAGKLLQDPQGWIILRNGFKWLLKQPRFKKIVSSQPGQFRKAIKQTPQLQPQDWARSKTAMAYQKRSAETPKEQGWNEVQLDRAVNVALEHIGIEPADEPIEPLTRDIANAEPTTKMKLHFNGSFTDLSAAQFTSRRLILQLIEGLKAHLEEKGLKKTDAAIAGTYFINILPHLAQAVFFEKLDKKLNQALGK